MLNRFDKNIGPLLTNVFSKIIHLDEIKQWNDNYSVSRRYSSSNRFICQRLFTLNNSLNQPSLRHGYPNLHRSIKQVVSDKLI